MNACAVEKAFLFAPELDVATRHLTNVNLDDIRKHNDYCADVCSAAPERLLGFCTLNPTPNIADGELDRAVDLMIEEAHRCYHELGLRGAGELVPARWYPNDPSLLPLWETLAELGMYTVFHTASSMMGVKAPTAAQSPSLLRGDPRGAGVQGTPRPRRMAVA